MLKIAKTTGAKEKTMRNRRLGSEQERKHLHSWVFRHKKNFRNCLYTSSPVSVEETFQDLQWMPETTDIPTILPNQTYRFSPMHTYL